MEPTLSRIIAAAGITAFLGIAAAALPALADLPARKLKPTLPAADSSDVQARELRGQDRATVASATEGRLVSFATRDLDIGKLDAAAFGDGEEVAR